MIGIIGGSGLYAMEDLTILEERTIATPFGEPSDPYVIKVANGWARISACTSPVSPTLNCTGVYIALSQLRPGSRVCAARSPG